MLGQYCDNVTHMLEFAMTSQLHRSSDCLYLDLDSQRGVSHLETALI